MRKLHGVFLQKSVKNARNIAVNTFNSRSALAVSKISRYQQSQRESADGSGSVPVLPSLKIGRIYLGTLPIGISTSYEENTGKLSNHAVCNPAILVPDLKKILYGMESWWDFIETPEELKELTDAAIDQMWYAQLARTFGMDIAKKDMVENGEKTSH